jgi:hypothetical protein
VALVAMALRLLLFAAGLALALALSAAGCVTTDGTTLHQRHVQRLVPRQGAQ